MPAAERILEGLTEAANQWRTLAIIWHALFGALVGGLVLGWRPSNRSVAYLLVTPLLSVSGVAWASGNPFNGTVFLGLGLALGVVANALMNQRVVVSSPFRVVAGALLLVFGWGYPHFLQADRWLEYGYAAPLGLLPCPTLAAVIGITLILGGFRSGGWRAILASAGFVYGLIGVFRLGVDLDHALTAGASVLAIEAVRANPLHVLSRRHGRLAEIR